MPPPLAGPSNYGTPAWTQPSPDFAGHFNMNFDFNNMDFSGFPITPAMSDDRRQSCDTSSSGFQLDGSAFDDGVSPDDLGGYNGFNFNDYAFPQQITPNSNAAGPSSAPHTSPGAQLDQTFTYDAMHVDEGYGNDFTLFDGAPSTTGGEMFPSLTEGVTWGNFSHHYDHSHPPLQTGNSTLDELFPELKGH